MNIVNAQRKIAQPNFGGVRLQLHPGGMGGRRRSAMARFLTVNDFSGSPPVPRGNQEFNLDPEQTAADPESDVGPDSGGIEPPAYGVSGTRGRIASTTGKNRNDQ